LGTLKRRGHSPRWSIAADTCDRRQIDENERAQPIRATRVSLLTRSETPILATQIPTMSNIPLARTEQGRFITPLFWDCGRKSTYEEVRTTSNLGGQREDASRYFLLVNISFGGREEK